MSYIKLSEQSFVIAEATQNNYIDQMVQAYSGALEDINTAISKQYAKLAGVDPNKYYEEMLKYERLEKLKSEVATLYNKAATEAGKATKAGLTAIMPEVYNRQAYLVSWVASDYKFLPLNENVLKYAVTGNIDFWAGIQQSWGDMKNYTPMTGTLSDILKANAVRDLDRILQSITNGFITGRSYRDQAKEIARIIGDYSRGNGSETASGAMYNALRIARSEGTRIMNAAALALGEQLESQGFDVKKQWMATLDTRTRGSHQVLDGQKRKLTEDFDSPISSGPAPGQMGAAADNIGCRCSLLNIIDNETPEIRRARNPVTGRTEIIDYADYPQWAKENGL